MTRTKSGPAGSRPWRLSGILLFLVAAMPFVNACWDDDDEDKNPVPTLASLEPSETMAASSAIDLVLTGTKFSKGATVGWNGTTLTAERENEQTLRATIPAANLAVAGTAQVTVTNPKPGGGTSSALAFTINNPAPTLASITPGSLQAGAPTATLNLTGTGFVANSVVQWNGVALPTRFVSATRLDATVAEVNLAVPGKFDVRVVNPAPGGGVSTGSIVTVASGAPVATIRSISPSSAVAGSSAFTLEVIGAGFVSGAVVQWSGRNCATTFVSETLLRAAITAADVQAPGTMAVRVMNPGAAPSSAVSFTVLAGPTSPALTSLNPGSVEVGGAAFTLTVNGSGFLPGATVRWADANRPTTYVSATQLTAAIPASDLVSAGSRPITVTNPSPGGSSNTLWFLIDAVTVADLVHVSVATDGLTSADGAVVNGPLAGDGRYAVFASKASNLVAGDTNGHYDVFMRDTCRYAETPCAPSTVRISLADDGSQGNGDSGYSATAPQYATMAVSPDGRVVAFTSSASNLVPGDSNASDDVFVRYTCLGDASGCTPRTIRVSVRADGSSTSTSSAGPSMADGRYVAFSSADALIVANDTNGVSDIFLRDLQAVGTTQRITAGATEPNGPSVAPSFNGRYLAFVSGASNLVSGDTNGKDDVFLADLCIDAGCTPSMFRISVATDGGQGNGHSSEPRLAPIMNWVGRYIAFVSEASNLVPDDTNGVADVFLRDTCFDQPGCTPSTRRISVSSSGAQLAQPSGSPALGWSADAVLFVTAAAVTAQDTNGVADVYLRGTCVNDPCTPATWRISVALDGTQGNARSIAPYVCNEPWGPTEIFSFASEATNLLPAGVVTLPFVGGVFVRVSAVD